VTGRFGNQDRCVWCDITSFPDSRRRLYTYLRILRAPCGCSSAMRSQILIRRDPCSTLLSFTRSIWSCRMARLGTIRPQPLSGGGDLEDLDWVGSIEWVGDL